MKKSVYVLIGFLMFIAHITLCSDINTAKASARTAIQPKDVLHHLDMAYAGHEGFQIPQEEALLINKKGSSVYGEILPESINKLISYLKLTDKDVFYDLGSGRGKMTCYVFLTTPIKKAVGIELSATRHQLALKAKKYLDKTYQFGKNKKRTLNFIKQDVSTCFLKDATVIYLASTCFSDDFMKQLTKKLSHLKKGLRFITLTQLPELYGFKLVDTLTLPMSWSTVTNGYVYVLQNPLK